MCLCPQSYPTKSKYVNIYDVGTRLVSTFDCGKCSQCRKNRSLEYYLRSASEYNYTKDNNGFTYWDTFTYDDDHVPVLHPFYKYEFSDERISWEKNKYFRVDKGISFHKSDGTTLKTFDYRDFSLFIKNLRQKMKRDGYDVSGSLKYFFVSEYGDPIEHTFRPHYHCEFFVNIPGLTPEEFEAYVRKSWTHGRTDLSTPLYPRKNLKTGKMEGRLLDSIAVTNYVSKYVNKPFNYMYLLDNYSKDNNLPKEVYNIIKPFHRQSIGFGEHLRDNVVHGNNVYNNSQSILETGKVHFIDHGEHRLYPLPKYNKRKLFYDCIKNADGSRSWVLNELGRVHKLYTQQPKFDKYVSRLEDSINSINLLNVYISDDIKQYNKTHGNKFKIHDYTDLGSYITNLLHGRSIEDLAVYSYFYRGRLLGNRLLKPPIKEIFDYDCKTTKLDYSDPKGRWQLFVSHPDSVYVLANTRDNYSALDFYDPILGQKWFGKSKVPLSEFIKHNAINDMSFDCFKHFDIILDLINKCNYFISKRNTKDHVVKCHKEQRVSVVKSYLYEKT